MISLNGGYSLNTIEQMVELFTYFISVDGTSMHYGTEKVSKATLSELIDALDYQEVCAFSTHIPAFYLKRFALFFYYNH